MRVGTFGHTDKIDECEKRGMDMSDQRTKWQQQKIVPTLAENVNKLNRMLAVDQNFDVVHRDFMFAGRPFSMYFVDGFVKDDIMNRIITYLNKLKPNELDDDTIQTMLETHLGYIEVDTTDNLGDVVNQVLAGPLALLMDGAEKAIIIDVRTYPVRNPEEPDIERVVRGARDGFTETIVFNTALTRRRLRDPSLRMEYMQVGKRSKTDIALSYMEDVANPDTVRLLREKIEAIDVDGLPMAEKSLEEFVFGNNWNPYPLVRYTERPDVAAVHLLEGHILIYVDTSPSVMIAPSTLFHHVQHAEEYRQKPVVGAYLRWVRFLAMALSVILLPLWYLFATHPEHLPEALSFIGIDDPSGVPLFVQFILAELGADILRMASIHTPSPLASALGLVSAILIGQVAVEVGLFVNEVLLYLAIAVIGTFATPSYELGLANKFVRLFLLLTSWAFGWIGFVAGIVLWFALLWRTRSLDVPYLWPFVPFNKKAFWDVLVRSPIPVKHNRPSILSPEDPDRE